MKLPSLRTAAEDAKRTLLRFPVVLAVAAVGSIAACLLIDHEGAPQRSILFPVLFASILGIPLLTGITLTAERMNWSRTAVWAAQALALLLLIAYGSTVPQDLEHAPAADAIRLALLTLALVLFVAAGPFIARNEMNGFWQYNKSLFFRLLTAALYSQVLFAGLALAVAAIDNLFGISVPGKRYPEMWVLLVGVFGTWFFHAGVPARLSDLEGVIDYPKGLRIFATFVLVPLVLVYLAILYAYLTKILVTWEWPIGWVSGLILGFAGTGIFSFLVLYPPVARGEPAWLKNAPRWLFVSMCPVVIMLFFAVSRRVGEYGWTEGRYLAVGLGVWLGIIILYFLFSKKKRIVVIPGTLCVACLLVSTGPWGTLAVSERSQVARLRGLLSQHGILVNETIQKSGLAIPFSDVREISSVLTYLKDIHGYEAIQPWFRESLRIDSLGRDAFKPPADIAALMGIEYVRARPGSVRGIMTLNVDRNAPAAVQGYDVVLRRQRVNASSRGISSPGSGISYRSSDGLDSVTFHVAWPDAEGDTVTVGLRGILDTLVHNYGNSNGDKIPPDNMMATGASSRTRVKVYLADVRLQREQDSTTVLSYDADFYFGRVSK